MKKLISIFNYRNVVYGSYHSASWRRYAVYGV